jgi:hypothetical protein
LGGGSSAGGNGSADCRIISRAEPNAYTGSISNTNAESRANAYSDPCSGSFDLNRYPGSLAARW